jgi:hypothetical protein
VVSQTSGKCFQFSAQVVSSSIVWQCLGPHKINWLLWSHHLDGRNRMYLQTAKKPASHVARFPMPIYNLAAGHLDSLAIHQPFSITGWAPSGAERSFSVGVCKTSSCINTMAELFSRHDFNSQ